MSRPRVGVLLQEAGAVPPGERWLSAGERAVVARLRVPKRAADWRLGRWTAKRAVALALGRSLEQSGLAGIEIVAAGDGAPEAFIQGAPAPVAVSITHREGTAACAVAPAGWAIGCDLESLEPRSDSFVEDYFTETEQKLVGAGSEPDRPRLVATVWSGKESALKALRTGLRADTRSVGVSCPDRTGDPGSWRTLEVMEDATGRRFEGWWRTVGNFVLTVVSDPADDPPALLEDQAPEVRAHHLVVLVLQDATEGVRTVEA